MKYLLLFLAVLSFSYPTFALAGFGGAIIAPPPPSGAPGSLGGDNDIGSNQGAEEDIGSNQGTPPEGTTLENPLGYNSIAQFLAAVLDAVVLIAFPFLVLALVYAGFLFVMAQGNESKLSEARRTFIWVLLGALLVLGAKALAAAINATVTELRSREGVWLPNEHPLAQSDSSEQQEVRRHDKA